MEPRKTRDFAAAGSRAFIVRACAAFAAFAMNVAVARVMGPHQAGLFFLGLTCLIVLGMLARIGMDHVMVRFVSISTDHNELGGANGVLVAAFAIVTPAIIVISSTIYFASEWMAESLFGQPDFAPVLRAVGLCVAPFSLFNLLSYAIQGRSQISWSIAINTLLLPLCLLAIVVAFPATESFDAASLMHAAFAISVVIAAIGAGVWLRRSGLAVNWKHTDLKGIASSALPLYVYAIVSYVNTWAPQILLGVFGTPSEIAIFAVSQKTAALVVLVLAPVNTVVSPRFAAMYRRGDYEALRQFAEKVNGTIVLATIPLLATVFLAAPYLLNIFGQHFAQSTTVLRVLIVGQVFVSISGSVGFLLIMSGNERHIRNATVISAIVCIAASLLLIPKLGATGAAMASTSTMVFANAIIWMKVHQSLGINVFRPNLNHAAITLMRLFAR